MLSRHFDFALLIGKSIRAGPNVVKVTCACRLSVTHSRCHRCRSIACLYDFWAVGKGLNTKSPKKHCCIEPKSPACDTPTICCAHLLSSSTYNIISVNSVPAFKIYVVSVSRRLETRCNKLTLDIFFCPSRLFL